MKILIVNDDGITAPGIKVLAETFAHEHEVLVVAPENEMSGNSHAISFFKEIFTRKVDLGINVEAYSITGTPVDCVRYGFHFLAHDDIDLVISGINNLPNIGTDTIYSGTVNAALEGALLDIRAIAVSTVAFSEEEYYFTANFIKKNLDILTSDLFPIGTIANVNVPSGDEDDILGVKITPLGVAKYSDRYKEIKTENSTGYMLVGTPLKCDNNPIDCDVELFEKGYITVTPMTVSMTDFKALKKLKDEWK